MNQKNHSSLDQNDQHLLDLVNAGIDGDLSAAERQELDHLLGQSQGARDLDQKLKMVTRLLDELPPVEPPEYLQNVIERQVRLPVQNIGGIHSRWLGAHWLRTGFALAAGFVLTFGIYQMGSRPITGQDAASMTGTMMKNDALDQRGVLIDSIKFETDKLRGIVVSRGQGDWLTLDVSLKSENPYEVVVDFAGRGLQLDGVTTEQEHGADVAVMDGVMHLASNGDQHYTVNLKRAAGVGPLEPLELHIFSEDKLVQHTRLIISQD